MSKVTKGIDTGILDMNLEPIFTGNEVKLFDRIGEVCMECGAYGIGFHNQIDWDRLEEKIEPITGCRNNPHFCYNDNFISFWELLWNYNCEEDVCIVVEVIGKEKTE